MPPAWRRYCSTGAISRQQCAPDRVFDPPQRELRAGCKTRRDSLLLPRHARTTCLRRPMGSHRTPAAEGIAQSRQGWLQGPLVVDPNGIPLAVRLSAASAHDSIQLLLLIDAIPPIIGPRGEPGRPRRLPTKLRADEASGSSDLRRTLRSRGIAPRIARRGIDSSERLGRYRWVVERTRSWLLGCRRQGVRHERPANLLWELRHRACALICLRLLGTADG